MAPSWGAWLLPTCSATVPKRAAATMLQQADCQYKDGDWSSHGQCNQLLAVIVAGCTTSLAANMLLPAGERSGAHRDKDHVCPLQSLLYGCLALVRSSLHVTSSCH